MAAGAGRGTPPVGLRALKGGWIATCVESGPTRGCTRGRRRPPLASSRHHGLARMSWLARSPSPCPHPRRCVRSARGVAGDRQCKARHTLLSEDNQRLTATRQRIEHADVDGTQQYFRGLECPADLQNSVWSGWLRPAGGDNPGVEGGRRQRPRLRQWRRPDIQKNEDFQLQHEAGRGTGITQTA